MIGPDGCGVGRGRRLGDPGLDAGWVGCRGRPVGGGGVGAPRLAQDAAVEDAAHVGLVAGPDDEQGDEEGCDGAEGYSNAGVVEGEPLCPLVDLAATSPVAVAARGPSRAAWAWAAAAWAWVAASWAAAAASGSVFGA